jgi:flagellar hook-length control protein FliK
MATAPIPPNDISESCPLEFKGKMNSGTQKGEGGTFKDGANSFLLTLLNMLVCANNQPLNTILDQNGVSRAGGGESDQAASPIDSIGDKVLNTENISAINGKNETTGKDIDTANIMNMIILSINGQLITSDIINGGSLPAPVISGIENADGTLVNLIDTEGPKSATTTNAINNILKMESVKNTLLNLIDEGGKSNEIYADCDLTCNIAGKNEAGDNVKIDIDSGKYKSDVNIDKAICYQVEKLLHDSAIRSGDGENKGNEADGNNDTVGDAGVQNENRDNVELVIDESKYQFGGKDLKILDEHGKNSAATVAARSGEERCDGENNNKNKDAEEAKVKGGHVNDLEKFGLGVGKTSVTVNSQENSIGSNTEIVSPKNQLEVLSGKIGGIVTKSDGEKSGDNSDKGDSSKNNSHEQNEKTVKGHEIIDTIKNNKALGQATNESTFTTISSKKVSFDANIHHGKDLEIEKDINIDSQIFDSQKSDIKNSEISTQTKTIPTNDRQLQASILSQVIDKTSVSLRNGLSSIEIKLKPEALGNLKMHISTENNQVSIKIVTEGQLVKEIVENNIMQLKSDLQSQGIEITKVEVVADHDSSHNNSNHGHSKFASFDNKNDNENQPGNQEKWDMDHEDAANEGRISFFA